MIQKEVSAKLPAKEGRNAEELSATVVINYAETLDEARELYGEEAILSNAFANWRVTLQSNIRAKLIAGATAEQIQDALVDARMGVAATGGRVDPQTAFIAKFKMSTPEQQAEMLEALKVAAQG